MSVQLHVTSCTFTFDWELLGTGLPECAWAAALPVNAERLVGNLVQDIYGDHQHIVRLLFPLLQLSMSSSKL